MIERKLQLTPMISANMDPYLVTAMIFDTCILHAKCAKLFPSPSHKSVTSRRNSKTKQIAGSVHDSESEDAGSEGSEGLHHAQSPRKSDLKKKGKNGNGCAAIM